MKEMSRRVENKETLQYISQYPSFVPFVMVPLGTACLYVTASSSPVKPAAQSPTFV